MSKREIREAIKEREGVRKVRITRAGDIHAYGNMPRGDGGRLPWWMFVGHIDDPQWR
jgi:hypothetical protein